MTGGKVILQICCIYMPGIPLVSLWPPLAGPGFSPPSTWSC